MQNIHNFEEGERKFRHRVGFGVRFQGNPFTTLATSLGGLVPTSQTNQTTDATSNGTQGTAGTQAQQQQYTTGQANLQNQLGTAQSNFLNNGAPSSFTANPNLIGAYTTAFNQNQAPGIAATAGAGSPQLQSNYDMGLQNLLANQFNTGTTQYQNALSGAGSYALTPTGQTQQNSGLTSGQSTTDTTLANTVQQPQSLLSLMNTLQSLFPNFQNPFGSTPTPAPTTPPTT